MVIRDRIRCFCRKIIKVIFINFIAETRRDLVPPDRYFGPWTKKSLYCDLCFFTTHWCKSKFFKIAQTHSFVP